jgi:hypothetical protein
MMRSTWTAEQVALLFELYSDSSRLELTEVIGKSHDQIRKQAHRLGISKSKEYLIGKSLIYPVKERGEKTRFAKGHATWNKGLTGVNGQSNTKFKEGNSSHNTLPVGATRVDGRGYVEVKIDNTNAWKLIHVLEWEKFHGPVQSGFCVIFRDGNKSNTSIENLELLSRAELMQRNSIHRYPQELASAIRLVNKLKGRINDHENNS